MQVAMKSKEPPELSRKDELLRKKRTLEKRRESLPKSEDDELKTILKEEEIEAKRGALIHGLIESATKYARRHIGVTARDITTAMK